MANAPFPSSFFFPITAPMYAHTSAFLPPPFGFGAPPSGAYPAPPPGFVPAPAYSNPPTFPYAGTCSHPAAAYSPPPGFVPPAYGAQTACSCAATYPYPPRAPAYTPIPTNVEPNWPPPAPDPNTSTAPPVLTPPLESTAPPTSAPPTTHSSLSPTQNTSLGRPVANLTPSSAQPWARSVPSRGLDSCAQQIGDLSIRSTLHGRPKMHQYKEEGRETEEDDSATLCKDCPLQSKTSGNDIITDPAPQHKPQRHAAMLTRRSLLDISRRMDEHQVQSQRALDSLQGELSKLVGRLSSLSNSMVVLSPSSNTSTIKLIAFVSSMSASTVPSAPAYIAPQVFGEMPTTIYGQETHGTVSSHCPGHHSLIQRSYMSNLIEQNCDGMPQPHGLNNLHRRSIFLADGTDRSYFALPENYPLERDTPDPVFDVYGDETEDCSTAFVDVSAGIPEQSNAFADAVARTLDQQLYEEEQPETEHSSACLNISSNVQDFTHKMQQQDNEKTSVIVQQLKTPPLNVLVIDEPRNEWRPGENTVRVQHRTEIFLCNNWLNIVRQSMSDHPKGLNPLSLPTPWDQGDTLFQALCTAAAGTTKMQCTDACMSARLQVPDVLFSTRKASIFEPTTMCWWQFIYAATTKQRHRLEFSLLVEMLLTANELNGQLAYMPQHTSITSSEWVSQIVIVLSYSLPFEMSKHQWDPGIAWCDYMYSWLVSDSNMSKTGEALVWLRNALLNDLQCQLPMSKSSCVWDPGIEVFFFLYKRLTETEMIHIPSWTSMTTGGISLPAYPYIVDFLNAQLEFAHQQHINENFKTKCVLLSLKKYFQIWDIGTFFTTFLPP